MPDICMCIGGDCPLKETCYRYRAIPTDYRQSYFLNPPYEGDHCDHYGAIHERDQLVPLDQISHPIFSNH
jgi:hypothetical protein